MQVSKSFFFFLLNFTQEINQISISQCEGPHLSIPQNSLPESFQGINELFKLYE